MPSLFDVCDIAPQGSELRKVISSFYKHVPAWNNGYIKCEDIGFHDICIKDVLLLYEKEIDFRLSLPCPDEIRFQPEEAYVVVKCANESIRGCSAVYMHVKYDVVIEGHANQASQEQKCYLVWEMEEKNLIKKFYTFKEWTPITDKDLSNYLRLIDGSSIIVDLNCEIQNNCVHVCGKIVDKLWKEENLVVLAAKPYNGVLSEHEFPETHIPSCKRW
ncbi:MAG: hypothetical protein ACOX6E_10585 [Syntrophomonadaceae bacterium]